MGDKLDFGAQFRSRDERPHVYMNGATVGCGDHPSLPKRHKWSKVRVFGRYRDRICLNCSLTESVGA
jgi:hypothetical protein